MARNIISFLIISLLAVGCSDKNPEAPSSGFISGKVTVDGIGIDGVTIRISAYTTSQKGASRPKSPGGSEMSAADGDYSIELLPGRYRIDFDAEIGGTIFHTARYPIDVRSGQETKVDVELKDPIPANLLVSEDDALVRLSWEPGFGSDSHRVYRSLDGESNFVLVGEIWSDYPMTVVTSDSPPSIGAYDYRVTSITGGLESDPSPQVMIQFAGAIDPPSNLQAKDRITHVDLIWDSKESASLYKIYRGSGIPNPNWALIDSTTANSFADVPDDYADYYYYLTAVSIYGTESGPSAQVFVAYDGRYDPPSALTLLDRGSNFYLTWADEGNNGYFNIYRSPIPDGSFTRIDSTFNTYFEDTPAVHDYYFYRISIVGPNGMESDESEAVGAYFDGFLDAPAQVQAVDRGLWVDLGWSEVPWSGAYIIYRSEDGSTYHQIARVSSGNIAYMDHPPQEGTYYYRISTETVDGVEGPLSTPVSVLYTDNLTSPQNVAAENFGTFVIVSWDSVPNATGYKIFRSTSSDGGYVEIGQTDQTEFTDDPQAQGPYYYKVRAIDNLGHESPFSFYAYVYFTGVPLPPTGVHAVDDSYKVEIYWTSEDESYDFIVYRSAQPSGDYFPVDTVASETATDWPSSAGHYYYKVRAMAGPGVISDLSDDAHVYFSGILLAPSNLEADTSGGYISLTWDPVEGASEYDVYRGISESQMDLIQTVYAAHCTDAPDTSGTYFYAVTARTQGGLESSRSAPVIVVYGP